MAVGDITVISPDAAAIEVLASATVANGAPAGAAGIDANTLRSLLGCLPKTLRAAVQSTAGSGTMTATIRVWIRLGALGWVVAKALNGGAAIAETGTDTIGYSETVDVADTADRYYIELVAIAGTATAVKGLLVVSRPSA
jgi:hypothetical protein